MTGFLCISAPPMAGRTGFHRNEATRVFRQELAQLSTRILAIEFDDAFCRRSANLKRVLCKVDGQNANI
ncbi:hypothetical protein NIG5292_02867 [Nereida ignava]|nr:hypothetical protein NIG5292_02503 [Nereida ignava]CRK76799.1 hypothetical protein NIG5292_02867 [Nereida ignava]